jgi:predicted secreted protein
MSYIVPVLGETILVKIGSGASPEVFATPTLINTSRSISFATSTETDQLIDLENQSAPAQTVRRVTSTDCKIDGEGMVNKGDVHEWLEWAQGGLIKNLQITDSTWTVEGPFVLTSFQITGERLKSSTCQITLEQAGAVTVTEA